MDAAASVPSSRDDLPDGDPRGSSGRRLRPWLLGGIGVFVAMLVLRVLAESILHSWITARLDAAVGSPTRIEDVELRLVAGEIRVLGIDVQPSAGASAIHVESLSLRWRWRDLLRGVVVVDGVASQVDLVVDVQAPRPARSTDASPTSSRLRSLHVEGGSVALVMDHESVVIARELHGEMTRSTGIASEDLTTRLSFAARVGDGGTLEIQAALSPLAPAENWWMQLSLDRLDLRLFDPLIRQALEMDVERGWLSAHGWMSVGSGRLRGEIRPRFDEIQVLGPEEDEVAHPMAEAVFGTMLAGADLPIRFDAPAGEPALEQLAEVGAHELLSRVILRGFVRRLDTLEGYESAVGRLELDFPSGRLSFFDITLTKIDGRVDTPFVSIPRMDVVVEQSAVDSDVQTYKSIVLHRPTLTFVTGPTAATSQLTFDPQWQRKVNVLPYATDRFEIVDGRIEYRDDTKSVSTSLFLSDVDVLGENLARAKEGAPREAVLAGRARVMGASDLAFQIDFTPGSIDLDAAIAMRLEPLRLRDLNVLLGGRFGIDVDHGTLGFTAELDVEAGRLRGTVLPELHGVRVLGSDETDFDHPIREFLVERRLKKLDGTTLELDHRIRTSVLRELPTALLSARRRARS